MTTVAWHTKTPHAVAEELHSSIHAGLSSAQYEQALKRYGQNLIRREEKFRIVKLLWRQLESPLVFILIFAGIIAALLQEWADATVIAITIIINTAIGAFQEGKADKAFEKLKELIRHTSIVIREGREHEVDAGTLVPGDIIIVRSGDSIGADARIIESKNLSVNEAALTGEWMPSEKHAGTIPAGAHITERRNMLWMGTAVAEGWGKAIVVNTASHTEFGKIASFLAASQAILTPFQHGIKRLARYITAVIVVSSIIIFAAGVMGGSNLSQMFLTAVAIAVAAIPEGLPVATTVILAIGMGHILKKGGLVRNLLAAETLGSTSVILTDKTGTLTRAEMEVSDIITPEEIFFPERTNADGLLAFKLNAMEVGILSSDAFIENPEAEFKDWVVRGKPTEAALLRAGIHAGLHPAEMVKRMPRMDFMPFDAERRFAASLNKVDAHIMLSIAGAPEKILALCDHVKIGDKISHLGDRRREELAAAYQKATGRGSRVLGLAYKTGRWSSIFGDNNKDGDAILEDGFVFVGFVLLHDPLREDVKESIRQARAAGLRPIMMTGDHRKTAIAVAELSGLSGDAPLRVMDGEELDKIDAEEFEKNISDIDIYARVLPHQKMRIVEAWQRQGAVVAMTGDGVNDAPALKRANIGIALGSGTDVAKESSDLVLLNNSFSVIVAAIEEGRVIMDNMRKVITFLLSTGFTEIVLIGGAIAAGLPLPILPAQILWANLIEEGFMNFAFAFEPKEPDVMKRNLQMHSSEKILTREMIWIIFGIGLVTNIFLFLLFAALIYLKYPLEEIRTMMFLGLAIDALFFAYPLKSLRMPLWKISVFSNPYLIAAHAISMLFLVAALTVPPLRSLLSIGDISLGEFLTVFSLGVLDLIAIETVKWYFIKKV